MLQRRRAGALTALGSGNFARSVGLTRQSRAGGWPGKGRWGETAGGRTFPPAPQVSSPDAGKAAAAAAGELSLQHHRPNAWVLGRRRRGNRRELSLSTEDLCPPMKPAGPRPRTLSFSPV